MLLAVAEDNPGKGARLLFSNTSLAPNAFAALQALRPAGPEVVPSPVPCELVVDLSASEVRQAALSFAPGFSGGPSEFPPILLRETLPCGPSTVQKILLTAFNKIVNTLSNGHVSPSLAAFWASARLIGLGKAGGGSPTNRG